MSRWPIHLRILSRTAAAASIARGYGIVNTCQVFGRCLRWCVCAGADRLVEDVNKVLAMPDVIEKLEQYGAEDGGGTAQRFADFIRAEQQKWAKVIKDANVRGDA